MIPQFEPLIQEDYAKAVAKQVLSGWVGSGKTTEEFEAKICEITGAKYCVSTTSGTTAIMIALGSLELGHSTVLFPAYTFLAGANAARYLGMNVRLIDVMADTACMSPYKLKKPYQCVMFVNHNAYVGHDVNVIREECDELEVPMIEDSSQALGVPGAGRTGDLGIFSFSVPKIVTTGQGGAVITDREDLYEKCKRIRDHGDNWRKTRTHEHLGVNFKFNDISAALGLAQLKVLDKLLYERERVFYYYRRHINLMDHGMPSTWMVVHKCGNPDEVIDALAKEDIQAVRYYKPVHHNPPYATTEEFPRAERIYETCLYLPSSLGLQRKTINKIGEIVAKTRKDVPSSLTNPEAGVE